MKTANPALNRTLRDKAAQPQLAPRSARNVRGRFRRHDRALVDALGTERYARAIMVAREPLTHQEFAHRFFPSKQHATAATVWQVLEQVLIVDVARTRPEDTLARSRWSGLNRVGTLAVAVASASSFGDFIGARNGVGASAREWVLRDGRTPWRMHMVCVPMFGPGCRCRVRQGILPAGRHRRRCDCGTRYPFRSSP